jgi:hypothetical protein
VQNAGQGANLEWVMFGYRDVMLPILHCRKANMTSGLASDGVSEED